MPIGRLMSEVELGDNSKVHSNLLLLLSPFLPSVRASLPVRGPHLAPEHAPRPVVDLQLEALSQVSKIQDPEVIQRQQGGGTG